MQILLCILRYFPNNRGLSVINKLLYRQPLITKFKFKEKVLTKPQLDNRPMLFLDNVEPLTKNNKLRSGFINKVMLILHHQFPAFDGLFCCTQAGNLNFPKATGDKWMQIIHDKNDH